MAAPFTSARAAPPAQALSADVVFIGEQHDNPVHHELQADWVRRIAPKALVFEMLTPQQAALATPENRGREELLERALGWNASGWPDFALYYPVFAAAPTAEIFGAGVPREDVRGLMEDDLRDVFGVQDAARFGLDRPLSAEEQQTRERLQAQAHCDALPEDLLPVMVSVQRLRDAALARAALDAFERTGGPVVVITGNGHARRDWGAPAYLSHAAPNITQFTVAQGEDGTAPGGDFDTTLDSPGVDRGDPCAAFN